MPLDPVVRRARAVFLRHSSCRSAACLLGTRRPESVEKVGEAVLPE